MADVVPSSTALLFFTNFSEKRNSTSSGAIQVKNRGKAIGTEENLDVISRLEKGEGIVDIGLNAKFALLAYVQFIIMLMEFKEMLSQEIKCLCTKTTTVLYE